MAKDRSARELWSLPTMSIREAARLLGISEWAAYKAARSGDLPIVRMGNRVLVKTSALAVLVDRTSQDAAPETTTSAATPYQS